MKEHIEYMKKILDNPYYPVDLSDYPNLFDFSITENGIVYLNRLRKEYNDGNELSEDEYLYLSMLNLGYAVLKKSVEECHSWQEYLYNIGDKVNLDKTGIKERLMQMGCITENPSYNPKLYKSHLIWKNEILNKIDRLEKS